MELLERHIYIRSDINGSIEDVWKAWTTREGIISFFGRDCEIELKVSGRYEIYFDLSAPEGKRGSEGCIITAFQKHKMLSFTWNSPPHLPEVRNQKTLVLLRFEKLDPHKTRIHLTHIGWGEGDQWDESFDYFSKAWKDIVIPRLAKRFSEGPIKWE